MPEDCVLSGCYSVVRRVDAIANILTVVSSSVSSCGSNRRRGWAAERSFLVRIRYLSQPDWRIQLYTQSPNLMIVAG